MDATRKKALIVSLVFLAITGLVILLANLAFRRPNHHDEAKWGVVHIQMADGPLGWSQHHMEVARRFLPELNRLGPTFVIGGDGPQAVRVVNVDLTSNGVSGHCTSAEGAARFVLSGERHIEIDPTCTQGDDQFGTALMHEVGHFLDMGHICQVGDHESRDCSPIGRGIAVMNPGLVTDTKEDVWSPGADGVYHVPDFPVPCFQIQALDVQEFERAHPLGHL